MFRTGAGKYWEISLEKGAGFRKRFKRIKTLFMGMNKNTIFAWASFCTLLIGIALVLLGVLKYLDYAIGFCTAGIGFFVLSWAFNALKGRV